ncbi:hypothetical protein Tco_0585926 [Tanacetum coccineum]
MSSECNNVKLAIWNDKSKVVYAMCNQYLIPANHDVCVLDYVNGMNSHGDNAWCSKHMTGNLKLLINFVWKFLGTFRFGNDHIAAILGYEQTLKEVKRIFRYLWGTVNMGLWYTKDSGFELTGFSYADYVGCKDTFKSTSGGTLFLGEKLLTDYDFNFNKILIYCDSKSAIAISCNPVQHSRTKHIVVCYHFIKLHMEKGTIELYFVKTDYQLADLFTKALPVDRFNYLVRRLGMRSLSPQELEHLAKSQ